MCLAQEPQVLLLDEPTSHLDIGHQLSILNLIKSLNRQTCMTVVAVFHNLNLAAEYCDRLVLLDWGRVAAVGTPWEVLTAETIQKVYGAEVLVERNPASDQPHVILAANLRPVVAMNPRSRQCHQADSADRLLRTTRGNNPAKLRL